MSLLLDTVRRVIRSGDYSLRAVQGPGGGVAELAAGLNTLLDQIELRDIQIKAYREELDEKIRIRTEVPKAKEAAVRLETSLSPTAPRSRKTPPQLAGIRALLVDDNITNVALLREALTRFGMQCDAALSGREALFLIQGNLDTPYDVAVLELVLPGMDGLELARVIKADPANAGLRLMMLTGFGKDCDLDEVIAAGIDYYMERPVCIERICDGIAFLTGRADDSAPWSESHPIAAGTTLSALGEGGPKGNYSG